MLANNLAGVLGSEKDMRSKWQWRWSDLRHHLCAVSLALFVPVLSREPPNCPALRAALPASPGTSAGSRWDTLLGGKSAAGPLGEGQHPQAAALSALPCWEEARRVCV